MATVKIKGTPELIRQLRKAQDQVLPELEAPVEQAAERALSLSKFLVPYETGEMKQSGYVEPAHVDTSAHVVSASCGYTHPHAAEVHEGVHGHFHKPHPPRFLRRGVRIARREFRRNLVRKVNEVLKGIFGTSK